MGKSRRECWWTCGYGSNWRAFAKRQANKRIRKTMDIIDGMIYKRFYDSWDICDFKIYDPKSPKVKRK